MGRGGVPCPKGPTRKQLKAKRKRRHRRHVRIVREYVFARERDLCRCCRSRAAHSMHELLPRSLGGKVSRANSVAVCGTGTTLCHGYLQRHEIAWSGGTEGAEGTLYFRPQTIRAAAHLDIELDDTWVSPNVSLEF